MNQQHDILLAHDHSKLDAMLEIVFKALEGGDRRKTFQNLDFFWALLAVHIRAEHLHLFPVLLRKASDPGLPKTLLDVVNRLPKDISTLKRDHDFFVKEIGRDVNRLRGGDSEEAEALDLNDIEKSLTVVTRRLEKHNRLEENDIYPLASALLSAKELADLRVSIDRQLENIPPRFRIDREDRRLR